MLRGDVAALKFTMVVL
ncbi:unnamed protein product [Cuscuta epithymum]|uniref:Uncharacterized protein n=1 Tax=Cuscuta epithymum TaxID=186058 RepID=A0AAV0ES30_9ASTE|nr:unnamed protein product [Cuscuta epithymum]